MRSWLFAPGDSDKKMAKAAEGEADIVIFDLEDAVIESGKPAARAAIAEFLGSKNEQERARLWVRVNPLDGEWTADDLAAIMPARPGGIMLPKSRGRHDVEELDRQMTALEAENGIEPGSTPVIALVTETAAAMFTTGDYGTSMSHASSGGCCLSGNKCHNRFGEIIVLNPLGSFFLC